MYYIKELYIIIVIYTYNYTIYYYIILYIIYYVCYIYYMLYIYYIYVCVCIDNQTLTFKTSYNLDPGVKHFMSVRDEER